MADEQRDRGPVGEGIGGPVIPGTQPPPTGAHGTGADRPIGPEAALVKPGRLQPAGPGPVDSEPSTPLPDVKLPGGRISGVWVALTLSAVVLIFLLIFIVQNNVDVPIRFLGMAGTLPLGVALLFAAALGVLLVAIPGCGRMLQLRRALRKHGVR
jgi:uncharacterized integral membrane protein